MRLVLQSNKGLDLGRASTLQSDVHRFLQPPLMLFTWSACPCAYWVSDPVTFTLELRTHLSWETLISRHEDSSDNSTITCCMLFPIPSKTVSNSLLVFCGTWVHWVNDMNSFRTRMPGSHSFIELWALFVYFWLFHKFLALLSIEIYLLIFCLVTQSTQSVCYLSLRVVSHCLGRKYCIFCSFGDLFESTLFLILEVIR